MGQSAWHSDVYSAKDLPKESATKTFVMSLLYLAGVHNGISKK